MKEFCEHCSELEAQLELLRSQHYKEIQCMKQKLEEANRYSSKLRTEIEALSLDVAFYNKNFTLPSQEGK